MIRTWTVFAKWLSGEFWGSSFVMPDALLRGPGLMHFGEPLLLSGTGSRNSAYQKTTEFQLHVQQ